MTTTNKTILRWGLLSTARINRAVIHPIRQSRRSQLLAVASRTAEKAQSYAQQWDIPRAHASYEALLADPEIDAIYNPLPNAMHAEWTIKALQAGKHVLCEKPLDTSLEAVDAIIQAAQQTGKIVAEAFMYRHHPQTLQIVEMVKNGLIGELQAMRGVFTFDLTRPDDPRLDPALGGGSIWDVGCYPISFARTVAGCEPEEVFGWQISAPNGIDLLFSGQMRFVDPQTQKPILAQFTSGFISPFNASIELIGSTGRLNIPTPFKPGRREKLYLWRGGDRPEAISIRGQELYLGEIQDMEAAVLDGKTPRLSLADSRGNIAAILGLLQSARSGKPILLKG
ncbi:MAG TPA: Gfo/Idh/MocA family oxidoreductase [Anaerolineales bacterium]|nr:Gfo/Idh/MocA family oxidoreductase [Anaerolineales bacterium]